MKSTNVQATLKELEAQRDLILMAIASLKAIDSGKAPELISNGNGKTIVGVAVAHLRRVGKLQTSQQLREAIQSEGVKATPGSIQTILSKRVRMKKDLVKKGRAVWGLKKGA